VRCAIRLRPIAWFPPLTFRLVPSRSRSKTSLSPKTLPFHNVIIPPGLRETKNNSKPYDVPNQRSGVMFVQFNCNILNHLTATHKWSRNMQYIQLQVYETRKMWLKRPNRKRKLAARVYKPVSRTKMRYISLEVGITSGEVLSFMRRRTLQDKGGILQNTSQRKP
jgi:hypothetical protein